MKRRIKKGLGILLAVWVECLIKDCKNSDFKEVNAGWVARQLQVTLSHLSRTFLLLRGISLHEFIDREKIKRAEILLKRYPKIKIKKVADTLGYSSVSYFARVFMKYNDNVSPLCYRIISYLKLDWPRSGKQETAQTSSGITPTSPEATPTLPEMTHTMPGIIPTCQETIHTN